MRKYLLSLVLLTSTGVGTAPPPHAQESNAPRQSRGMFKTEINFVEVHAIVTDEAGRFVKDLTRDDFEIYEAGKLQTPAAFSLIDVPIERPFTPPNGSQPVEWDVQETTTSFDGRIYVLALDDLHTAFTRSQLVRDAARAFVAQYLGANDRAAVVYTSGRQEAGQELTGSRRLLLAAIERFQGQKLPSAGAEKLALHLRDERAIEAGANEPQSRTTDGLQRAQSVRDPYDAERALSARRTFSTVQRVAAWLADVPGRRKSLLLFSEGFDYDIYEPFNRGASDSLLRDAQRAVAAAQRANVTVYGIDPRGLSQFGGLVEVNAASDYPQLGYGTLGGLLSELLLSQESLISLAEQTGGLAIVRSGDVVGGLGRIVLDNSRYYLLGYYSDSTKWSDRFLNIEVKTKRAGLRVRARRGYMPPDQRDTTQEIKASAGTSPALKAALSKPLPVGTLPLRAFAAPFKGTGRNASVLVALEIDGQALTFEERDGRFHDTVETSIVATDERGRVQGGDRQTFELQLLPDTYRRIGRTGVRLLSRLDLPPGRYQIRVGAYETGDGAVAMLPYDLEVPDYSRMPFEMSGVLLTSSEAELFATANVDRQSADVLPAPPIVSRKFSTIETLTCFLEVYHNALAAREIDFMVTVQHVSDGRTVFRSRDQRALDATERASAHRFRTDIPLKDWSPGVYVLRVEATAGNHVAAREVPFQVGAKAAPNGKP